MTMEIYFSNIPRSSWWGSYRCE